MSIDNQRSASVKEDGMRSCEEAPRTTAGPDRSAAQGMDESSVSGCGKCERKKWSNYYRGLVISLGLYLGVGIVGIVWAFAAYNGTIPDSFWPALLTATAAIVTLVGTVADYWRKDDISVAESIKTFAILLTLVIASLKLFGLF